MRGIKRWVTLFVFCLAAFLLNGCSSSTTYSASNSLTQVPKFASKNYDPRVYAARLPQHITPTGTNTVLVNPNVHAWGAYDPSGNMVRGGLATAGANWCPDLGRPCHTHAGTFHVEYLGSASCFSSRFPIPRGGAPMPYCMYFNQNQALHGSGDHEVVDGNISHGCVRMHVSDAEWLRFNFVKIGTMVIVEPY